MIGVVVGVRTEPIGPQAFREGVEVGLVLRPLGGLLVGLVGEILTGSRARCGIGHIGVRALRWVAAGLGTKVVRRHGAALPGGCGVHASPS